MGFTSETGATAGRRSALLCGRVGNTAWARSMHAKHIKKYHLDPTMRWRTIKGNRHPETRYPQRPDYETTGDVGDQIGDNVPHEVRDAGDI